MSRTAKPILHGRDHEWGGADPAAVVYESVGGSGGGGSSTLTTVYKDASDPMTVSTFTNVAFTKSGTGADLLDLTTPTVPTFLSDGVYSVAFTVRDAGFLAATKAVYLHLSSSDVGFAVETEVTVPSTVAGSFSATVTTHVFFANAGDELEALVSQSGGGTHTFFTNIYLTKIG